jgi:hypothetical protein
MFVDCETTERLQEAAALLNSSYDRNSKKNIDILQSL